MDASLRAVPRGGAGRREGGLSPALPPPQASEESGTGLERLGRRGLLVLDNHEVGKTYVLALWAAEITGRSVKWISERSEGIALGAKTNVEARNTDGSRGTHVIRISGFKVF